MTAAPEFVNTEIPRDRWGRPMVLQPGSKTKRIAYRRATTFVGCLDDTYNLMNWKTRQVAYGMGQRPDLVLAAAALPPESKKRLGEVADKAAEHALSSAGATTGTALHSFIERLDRGQPLGFVPEPHPADLKAYEDATKGIEWLDIESFRVNDQFQVAGTTDRVGRDKRGRLRIYDIKTGRIDYPHKMAMQLAMYAHSIPYNIETDERGKLEEDLDLNRGIIIHLPVGEGRCDLYEIDIASGWGACLIAKKVWDWRGIKDLTRPLEDPAAPPTWESLVRDAANLEDLRVIWTRAQECGELTEDLRALCTERSRELQPTE